MNCYWCYQPIEWVVGRVSSGYRHTHSGHETCDSGYSKAESGSPMPRPSYYDHASGTFKLQEPQ